MKYVAVTYEYHPHHPELAKVRPLHREFIAELKDKGFILGSGPYTDSAGGALIVVQLADDAPVSAAIDLLDEDPFHTHAIATRRYFREWNPVINSFAS